MYPHERSLVKEHKDAPFVLLGISVDSSREILEEVIEREELTWPIIYEGRGPERPNVEAYGVEYIPAIYLVDHEGILRYKHVRGEELDQAIRTLLEQVPE